MDDRKYSVLYIDGVGPFGGSSRSLSEAINSFPKDAVSPNFIAAEGTAADLYQNFADGIVRVAGLSRFDNTLYGHYKGLRWVLLARELASLPMTFYAVIRARLLFKSIDIIHVNEITELLPALLAKLFFRVPIIVHVRSVQNNDKSKRTRFINWLLKTQSAAVIAIDNIVLQSIDVNKNTYIIRNSFSDQSQSIEASEPIRTMQSGPLRVGFVGNMQRMKGILQLAQAAKILRDEGVDIKFVFVGGDVQTKSRLRKLLRRLGYLEDSKASLVEYVKSNNLHDIVELHGHMVDVSQAFKLMDVVCFPSFLNAPGRPVFEAAHFGLPAIVTLQGNSDSALVDGVNCILIEDNDPKTIVKAIRSLNDKPEWRIELGINAKRMALSNHDPETNSAQLLTIYRNILDPSRSTNIPKQLQE